MVGKIKIDFNKSAKEVQEILRKTKITLKIRAGGFGYFMESGTKWKSLDNLEKFKFVPTIYGPLIPWWGSCSLKDSEVEGKSSLKMTIWPPKFFVVAVALIYLVMVVSVILKSSQSSNGLGKVGFLIFGSLMFGLVIGLWRLIFQHSSNKIKREIIRSLRENSKVKD